MAVEPVEDKMAKARLMSKDRSKERKLIASRDMALEHKLSSIVTASIKSTTPQVTAIVERHINAVKTKDA